MLLQPLYENAIKHGVYESVEKVTITTSVTMSNGLVEMTITNNFDREASAVKGTGTGLSNVTRRLELIYGNKAKITTEKKETSFIVRIFLPVVY